MSVFTGSHEHYMVVREAYCTVHGIRLITR